MRRLKQLLNEGRIGRPFRAHIQFSHADLSLYNNQPYLFTDPHFALHDMGPHLLDLPRFFFGEPHSLYAREFNVHPKFKGEDIVSIMLGYEKLTCHCELSWRTTPYQAFIEGRTGTLQWGTDGKLTIANDTGGSIEQLAPQPYPWADSRYGFAHPSIVATNGHLLAALRSEQAAETTGEDNLKTMRLVFAAQDSAARSEAVRLGPT
jgi:predicted dehydrogenase